MMTEVWAAAKQFCFPGEPVEIRRLGAGNVNDTFLVTLRPRNETGALLQRINTTVFPDPQLIMENLRIITAHIEAKLQAEEGDGHRQWEVAGIYRTRDGQDAYLDDANEFWRALRFIDGATAHPAMRTAGHAHEAGYALGRFHRLVADLNPVALHDTLPGFHNTPQYFCDYDRLSRSSICMGNEDTIRYAQEFIRERRNFSSVLEDARRKGILRMRIMHGDPKAANIMIDDKTGLAVGMVDLDTVKPGLVHYDIGDCLRSCCNVSGEETFAYEQVSFDLGLCRSVLAGYFSEALEFLDSNDLLYLFDAIRLLPFELGLRYFTDFLAGNVYFKVLHAGHNLSRAVVQFRLAESIEAQEGEIRKIIQGLL